MLGRLSRLVMIRGRIVSSIVGVSIGSVLSHLYFAHLLLLMSYDLAQNVFFFFFFYWGMALVLFILGIS